MPTIGVQQLRTNTAEVLRCVRQEHTEYVVTRKGKPVARLLPVETMEVQRKAAEERSAVEDYRRAMDEIRRRWPEGLSTQALMAEMRR